ncbi:hypothetical protein OCU04_003035 [Sclerotinia nivalis]|uniref:Uncharacterized protein n=1 Tax=Sclerotinia nivalis TaxID=352851 RepID=A0A9X0AUV3_9HELO|nr:hypothetical protein OCU04_003035 [Sclerotinia nivalis]
MGCGPSKPSKPSTPPAEAPRYPSTRSAYAPRTSDESSIHAARPVDLKSYSRGGNSDMNGYASDLQQQRHNNNHEPRGSLRIPQSRNEQDGIRIHESPLRKPLPNRKSSLGTKTLEVNTGRRRVGQSISNPNPNPVTLSPPTARGGVKLSSRSPSPVSSVGTTKWDRPDVVELGR